MTTPDREGEGQPTELGVLVEGLCSVETEQTLIPGHIRRSRLSDYHRYSKFGSLYFCVKLE